MNTRSKLLTAVLAGSLSFAAIGGAMAGSQGVPRTTDLAVRSVHGGILTLVDGSTYTLPYGFDASKLQPGQHVQVFWIAQEDKNLRDATMIAVD